MLVSGKPLATFSAASAGETKGMNQKKGRASLKKKVRLACKGVEEDCVARSLNKKDVAITSLGLGIASAKHVRQLSNRVRRVASGGTSVQECHSQDILYASPEHFMGERSGSQKHMFAKAQPRPGLAANPGRREFPALHSTQRIFPQVV
jgi:hypothetical protein